EAAADRRARAATALAMTEDLVRQNAGARPGSNRSLSELVDATATAAGVAIDRRREDAGGRLTVWVGAVEPASLMQWILALRKTHGVAVTAFAATKADAASLGVEISFARTTP
ncbi:MAG: type II secretion system protein M, partial [Brevundimonas diminuta]|nr:type II secretion system protein M [Brevundimonas diminuta]